MTDNQIDFNQETNDNQLSDEQLEGVVGGNSIEQQMQMMSEAMSEVEQQQNALEAAKEILKGF